MSKLTEINARMQEARAAARDLNKASLAEHFLPFFEKYPDKAFSWLQYANYFNDGEPCEFYVHDTWLDSPEGDQGEGELERWLMRKHGVEREWKNSTYELTGTEENIAAYNAEYAGWEEAESCLYNYLGIDDDILESMFGNDVRVTVSYDQETKVVKIDVEDYTNHD